MNINTAGIDGTVSHRFCHAAGRDIKDLAQTAVRTKVRCQKAIALFRFPDDCCPCAITKKDTGGTVMPVYQTGQNFCADHKDMFVHACLHHVGCYSHGIDIAGAAGGNIHGTGMGASQFILYQAGRRRHYIIRRCRSHQNEINIIRRDTGRFHGLLCRMNTEVRCIFRLCCNMPCFYAGSRTDPFI